MRYGLPPADESLWEKSLKLAFIVALHGLLIGAVAAMNVSPQIQEVLSRFDIRMIEEQPSLPVEAEAPKPLPVAKRPTVQRQMAETALPQPVMTSVETATTSVAFTVPAQPPQPPVEAKPEALPRLAPEPVSTPSFDANYLHNPAPVYPLQSRRLREEGRVLLKVLVSAQGAALSVQIDQGCGHPRLDEAALEAVRQWRFVPSRRGVEAVEGWVVVPISFRLDK